MLHVIALSASQSATIAAPVKAGIALGTTAPASIGGLTLLAGIPVFALVPFTVGMALFGVLAWALRATERRIERAGAMTLMTTAGPRHRIAHSTDDERLAA